MANENVVDTSKKYIVAGETLAQIGEAIRRHRDNQNYFPFSETSSMIDILATEQYGKGHLSGYEEGEADGADYVTQKFSEQFEITGSPSGANLYLSPYKHITLYYANLSSSNRTLTITNYYPKEAYVYIEIGEQGDYVGTGGVTQLEVWVDSANIIDGSTIPSVRTFTNSDSELSSLPGLVEPYACLLGVYYFEE